MDFKIRDGDWELKNDDVELMKDIGGYLKGGDAWTVSCKNKDDAV